MFSPSRPNSVATVSPTLNKRNQEFFQTEVKKDATRFEQYKRVQQNIESVAKADLDHLVEIRKRM